MGISALLGARSRRVALGAGIAVAVTGGIAVASIPGGDGTIHACMLKDIGTIRLIDKAKSGLKGRCSSLETEISWNQKGDPGAPGAPGAQGEKGDKGDPGEQGPSGFTGYQKVDASTTITPGQTITGFLPCPTGKRPTGGGWTTTENDFQVKMFGSGPDANNTGWGGGMHNQGSTQRTLTLTVYCVTVPAAQAQALAAARAAADLDGPVFTVVD